MKNWILQCKLYDLQSKENKNESINFYKSISNESGLWFLKSDKKGGLVEDRFKRKLFSKILAISFDGTNFIKMGKKTQVDLIEFWTPNYIIQSASGNTLYFHLYKPLFTKNRFKILDNVIININAIVNPKYQICKEITYFSKKSNIKLIDIHYSF